MASKVTGRFGRLSRCGLPTIGPRRARSRRRVRRVGPYSASYSDHDTFPRISSSGGGTIAGITNGVPHNHTKPPARRTAGTSPRRSRARGTGPSRPRSRRRADGRHPSRPPRRRSGRADKHAPRSFGSSCSAPSRCDFGCPRTSSLRSRSSRLLCSPSASLARHHTMSSAGEWCVCCVRILTIQPRNTLRRVTALRGAAGLLTEEQFSSNGKNRKPGA
jgi:hypothetical protein